MRRPNDCNCHCDPCDVGSVTLKAFAKDDGQLIWQHRLDNPVLSTDGHIYGYAFELDTSDEAKNSLIVPLGGIGAGSLLRIAASSTIRRFKKWVRKIALDGTVVGDSDFWWYTDNNSFTVSPVELPENVNGFMQDVYGATGDGETIQQYGDNRLGVSSAGSLIVWDSANTTTTRRYTFVAAALQDLATVPTGGAKIRFVAEDDGTNAETTLDVENTMGMTAADLATAVEALPHIVSATGTGGLLPFANVTLEVVWAQSTTHFKSIQRLTGTSRGYPTWLRDWDAATITAVVAESGSTADVWQLDDSDNVIGWSSNPNNGLPSGLTVIPGCALEKFTRSGGPPAVYSIAWRVRPTEANNATWGLASGQLRARYNRPAIRNGRLIVCHDRARALGQDTFEVSEFNEIDLSDGSLLTFGGTNDRFHFRPTFASDGKLYITGWNSFVQGTFDGRLYACDNGAPNSLTLTNSLDGYVADKFGPYGTGMVNSGAATVADTEALYSCFTGNQGAPMPSGWSAYQQFVTYTTDQRIQTILPRDLSGFTSTVAPDSYFSLGNYYRITYVLQSPINAHWVDSGMQWRCAFFTTGITPTTTSVPITQTAWLDFDADEADLLAALLALVGNNDAGPNAFVEGPIFPQTVDEPVPQMIWQRGIIIRITGQNLTFPPTTPPVVWNLADRQTYGGMYIQVRAAVANTPVITPGPLFRMDWATGDVIWQQPFGNSAYGGAEVGGSTGILSGDKYIVSGGEVNGTCFCVYQWQEIVYGVPEWVLVADYCPTGKTATPPEGTGTVGEYRNGTCV